MFRNTLLFNYPWTNNCNIRLCWQQCAVKHTHVKSSTLASAVVRLTVTTSANRIRVRQLQIIKALNGFKVFVLGYQHLVLVSIDLPFQSFLLLFIPVKWEFYISVLSIVWFLNCCPQIIPTILRVCYKNVTRWKQSLRVFLVPCPYLVWAL